MQCQFVDELDSVLQPDAPIPVLHQFGEIDLDRRADGRHGWRSTDGTQPRRPRVVGKGLSVPFSLSVAHYLVAKWRSVRLGRGIYEERG